MLAVRWKYLHNESRAREHNPLACEHLGGGGTDLGAHQQPWRYALQEVSGDAAAHNIHQADGRGCLLLGQVRGCQLDSVLPDYNIMMTQSSESKMG